MSWYVLQCRPGQERIMIRSCRRHLSDYALEDVFTFQCARLWKTDSAWSIRMKEMFPGYIFLQSSHPKALSEELGNFHSIFTVLEDRGYLISVYGDEEKNLRDLCGDDHFLKMSYGYKDRTAGISHITEGPLAGMENRIVKIDWHRRFAQIEIPLARRNSIVWAGVDLAREAITARAAGAEDQCRGGAAG